MQRESDYISLHGKQFLFGLLSFLSIFLCFFSTHVFANGERDIVVDKQLMTVGTILSGDTVDYEIHIQNNTVSSGGYYATGVTVTDTLASGMVFTGTWSDNPSGTVQLISAFGVSPIVWNIPHLFQGDNITISYSVEVHSTGSMMNTVEVTPQASDPTESDTGNNAASVQIDVLAGVVNGACGSKDGGMYYGTGGLNNATGTLCDAGIADTPDFVAGSGWTWRCASANGGTDDFCSAGEMYCGDTSIQSNEGEVCDDGNAIGGDGCNATCTAVESGYTCPTQGVACEDIDECALQTDNCDSNASCTNTPGSFSCSCNSGFTGDGTVGNCSVVCGDNIVITSEGEQCDDGNTNNGDGCSSLCIWETPICTLDITPGTGLAPLSVTGNASASGWIDYISLDWKDGTIISSPSFPVGHTYTMTGSFLVSLEIQNNLSGSTATGMCTDLVQVNTECGNGIPEIGEQCDDGANNGVVCTPGYNASCSYCNTECQNIVVQGNYCGDGILDGGDGEICDDGSNNGIVCTPGYGSGQSCVYCTSDCSGNITLTGGVCGDGVVNGPETCDDGNAIGGDGCSNICDNEYDYPWKLIVNVDNTDIANVPKHVLAGAPGYFVASFEFITHDESVNIGDMYVYIHGDFEKFSAAVQEIVVYDDTFTELYRKAISDTNVIVLDNINYFLSGSTTSNLYFKIVTNPIGLNETGISTENFSFSIGLDNTISVDSGLPIHVEYDNNSISTNNSLFFDIVPVAIANIEVNTSPLMNGISEIIGTINIVADIWENTNRINGSGLDLIIEKLPLSIGYVDGLVLENLILEKQYSSIPNGECNINNGLVDFSTCNDEMKVIGSASSIMYNIKADVSCNGEDCLDNNLQIDIPNIDEDNSILYRSSDMTDSHIVKGRFPSTNNISDDMYCGNGIVESGEECDDGNFNNGDGCSNICSLEYLPSGSSSSIIIEESSPVFSTQSVISTGSEYVSGDTEIGTGEESVDIGTGEGDMGTGTFEVYEEKIEQNKNPEISGTQRNIFDYIRSRNRSLRDIIRERNMTPVLERQVEQVYTMSGLGWSLTGADKEKLKAKLREYETWKKANRENGL